VLSGLLSFILKESLGMFTMLERMLLLDLRRLSKLGAVAAAQGVVACLI